MSWQTHILNILCSITITSTTHYHSRVRLSDSAGLLNRPVPVWLHLSLGSNIFDRSNWKHAWR